MSDIDFGTMLDKLRHIRYGNYAFRAICPICGEPVQCDESIDFDDKGYIKQPNATCLKHGRVEMPFAGTFEQPFEVKI